MIPPNLTVKQPCFHPLCRFMVDYIDDLDKDLGEEGEGIKVSDEFIKHYVDARLDFFNYRETCTPSLITGTMSTKPKIHALKAFYDTDEQFRLANDL